MGVDVVTFGCRLNACESEVIRREAQAAGVTDTVVVNTCAVNAEAVRQSRQTVRRLKRERPDARIVVTGCAAQIEPSSFADMPEVAFVLGNEEKLNARSWGETCRETWRETLRETWRERRGAVTRAPFALPAEEKIKVNDIMAVRETAAHLADGFEGRVGAFGQVQNGCDQR